MENTLVMDTSGVCKVLSHVLIWNNINHNYSG
jgi:hypothetical protein